MTFSLSEAFVLLWKKLMMFLTDCISDDNSGRSEIEFVTRFIL